MYDMGDNNGSMRGSEEPRSKTLESQQTQGCELQTGLKHDLGLGLHKPMETSGRPGHIECAPSHTTQHAQVVAHVPVLESHSFIQEPSVPCRTKDHSQVKRMYLEHVSNSPPKPQCLFLNLVAPRPFRFPLS